MFKYGILSTASIIDRFVAGIRESKDGHVQALASRTLDNAILIIIMVVMKNYIKIMILILFISLLLMDIIIVIVKML